jgi:hypothetical protein
MTAPPGLECGDVICVLDYRFDDGTISESKYFVVMGYYKNCVLGFLTTSQEKWGRQRREGCHPEFGNYPSNFYLKTKGSVFADGTWVLLSAEWHEHDVLVSKIGAGRAVRVHTFPDQIVCALRNCFERTLDWAPVCANYMCGGKS